MTSHRWKRFFTDANLPHDIADNYAIIFTENRIRFDMLGDLNKEILYDMGIKKIGDVILILRHAKEVHTNSYREKVFQHDEVNEKDLSKPSIHQADSTISSNVKQSAQQQINSTRIVQPLSCQSVTTVTGTNLNNNNKNKIPLKQTVSRVDPLLLTKSKPTTIVRQVTGLNTAPTIRKRIEPPSDNDNISSQKIIRMDKNIKPEMEAQNRLVNFSNQIQKAISSNNSNKVVAGVGAGVKPKIKQNIQNRLSTNKNTVSINRNITSTTMPSIKGKNLNQ